MLFEGEVNAAIAGDATELSERVDRWALFEERLMILMSQRNPLAKFAAIPADEFVGATWLERVGCEFVEAFGILVFLRPIDGRLSIAVGAKVVCNTWYRRASASCSLTHAAIAIGCGSEDRG